MHTHERNTPGDGASNGGQLDSSGAEALQGFSAKEMPKHGTREYCREKNGALC